MIRSRGPRGQAGKRTTARVAGLALLLACVLISAGTLAVLGQLDGVPLPPKGEMAGGVALELAAADGDVFAFRGRAQTETVELSELPRHLIDAVVAMEDRRFFEHHGVDPGGIIRAALANLAAGETVQGGSTITQQLAKNLFLSPERSWSRKIQEALLAVWLERHLSKEQILARYLNEIYFGAGAYGVGAASRRYFGKPAQQLSLAEAAMLVGLIQAPSRFAPTRSLEDARRRQRIVLDAMAETGAAGAAAIREARAHRAGIASPPEGPPGFGYAADFAAAEARRRLGAVGGDFVVTTTIAPRLQALAQRTIETWLGREGESHAVSQAALIAMTPDGAVLALAGGRDYLQSQFNRAVQARRQPGSAFKLFVYLAALRAGTRPDSVVDDAPLTIGGWGPRNYADRYLGQTDVRTAFAKSLNSVAVRLQERVGRAEVIALAEAMGIRTPLHPHPSLALGSAEVTLLDLTAAYAAVLANVGRVEPYVVQAIRAPGGAVFQRRPTAGPEPTWPRQPMMDLLRSAVRSGTGRAAGLRVPVFGKTGTTQDHRDAWFVGFTRDLVVGVWVGNDDNSPMTGVTGGGLPAKIWRSFVAEALGLPEQPAPIARADAIPTQPRTAGGVVPGIPGALDRFVSQVADDRGRFSSPTAWNDARRGPRTLPVIIRGNRPGEREAEGRRP